MVKFLKRVSLFIIVSFFLLNTVAFLVLNSPIVQHAVVNYININYLKRQNLRLKLDSLSLSFFSAAFNLNEVSIQEINPGKKDIKGFGFSLSQVSIGLDLPSSYINRKPVVKKVLLRGVQLNMSYDENGKIIFPDFLKIEDNNSEIDLPKIFREVIPNLPNKIEILNANIAFGKREDKNFQYLNVNLLEVNKLLAGKNFGVHINSNMSGTDLKFPHLSSNIKINKFDINGTLWQDGGVRIKNLHIDSNAFKLESSVNAIIESKIEHSIYEFNLDSFKIISKDLFNLFGLKSSGDIKLVGSLRSGKTIDAIPTFIGRAAWENLSLEGFSLYNGTAEVSFKDKIVSYKQAKIRTPRKGKINAEGKFELFGEFSFENRAHIEEFSFAELLSGLGVKDSPVDFNLKSPEMHVDGKMFSKTIKKSFELYATGQALAHNLQVIAFDQKGRKPLPNFEVNLNLAANKLGVFLDKSFVALPSKAQKSEVYIPKGVIGLTAAKGVDVSVDLVGSHIDIADLEYFLKIPAAGVANVTSSIKVTALSPKVVFQAKSTITKGSLLGINFNKIVGEWGLDSEGLWAKNTEVNLGSSPSKLANLLIKTLKFNFEDFKANMSATAQGSLNGLTSALPYWIPKILTNSTGHVNDLSIQLDGLLFHPSTWNLQAFANIKNFKILNGGMENFSLFLSCKVGNCQKSYIKLDSIYANNANENIAFSSEVLAKNLINGSSQKTDKLSTEPRGDGQVLIQIDDLSFVNSSFKTQVYQFPVQFFDVENTLGLDGKLNSTGRISGNWGNIEGFWQSKISNFKVNGINYGDLSLNMVPTLKRKLEFELLAFNRQLKSTFIIPQAESLDSKLDIELNNFNVTQLLSDELRAKNNIFSQLTGRFHFEGLLTSKLFKEPMALLSGWKGRGRFTEGIFQYERVVLNLNEKDDLIFLENKLKIPNISMISDVLNIDTSGSIDISNKFLLLTLNADLDFSKLKNAFLTLFDDPSSGSAHAKVVVSGKWDDLKLAGGMSLFAESIALKNYPPNLTNLRGQVNFKDKLIEIQKITATKGKGEINIAGNIDFSKSLSPDINLRVNAAKADLRLQTPVFLFTDVNLDSDITITGQGRPYLVSGDVNILNLQMFRDLTCDQISAKVIEMPKKDHTIMDDDFAVLNLNFRASNSINIKSQCLTGRFSTGPLLNISGNTSSPRMNGAIIAETANLQVLKTLFYIRQAELQFVDIQKYDPNVNIQMQGRVNSYNIYWKINGRLSQARLDLTADPPLLPNGDRIIEADIISMISTGQVPTQSSSANLLSASSGVASFLGINNFFDNTLNQTVNTVTGGLVDNVSIAPTSQNGQLSWRANASRSVSQRLDLGVSYENGAAGSTRSAYANYMFNDTVSAISSWNYSTFVQQQTTQEIFTGLRFQFGSQ